MISLQKDAVKLETNFLITITLFTIVGYGWYLFFTSAINRMFGENFQFRLFHGLFILFIVSFAVVVLFRTSIYELPSLGVDEALIEESLFIG